MQRTVPLHVLIALQFLVQVVGITVVVGWLTYHAGQRSVRQLAAARIAEQGRSVEQELRAYLGKGQEINRANVAALEVGTLDPDDYEQLGRHFYQQAQVFDFTFVNFGGVDGSFIGAGFGGGREATIGEATRDHPTIVTWYTVDREGNRQGVVSVFENTDHRTKLPWYTDAVRARQSTWSAIYPWGSDASHLLSIAASAPVYDDQQQLLGVLGIDIGLNQLSRALRQIQGDRPGEVYILERSGLLVASSADESVVHLHDGKAARLRAVDSTIPLIQQTAIDLEQRYGNWGTIQSVQTLNPDLARSPFVRVCPYRDEYGLNWLIVTVVPESEFLGEIYADMRRTVLFWGLAIALSISTSLWTARRMTRSLTQLISAAQNLAAAPLDPVIDTTNIQEVRVLSGTFRQMASSLQQAEQFQQYYQQELEQRVLEQTTCLTSTMEHLQSELSEQQAMAIALQEANCRLEKLSQTDGLTQVANRRLFDQTLSLEWQHLQQRKGTLSLILFDVDHFKRYNDYFGHQQGDDCLIKLAQASQQSVRHPKDLLARYGGEEFAILLSDTSLEGAIAIAKRLQQNIATLAIPHPTSNISSIVTISIGITSVTLAANSMNGRPNTMTADRLVRQADQALYSAKQKGRNCFVIF